MIDTPRVPPDFDSADAVYWLEINGMKGIKKAVIRMIKNSDEDDEDDMENDQQFILFTNFVKPNYCA